ncbi:hypothetical protein ACFWA6_04520 [Streptomyces sp. NPDC060020]|uniref:hypothetical protein n=1 Tax=Streptomyces sp. NPDC060020 TaxID=3347038 RepID=UPI0036A7E412
MKQEQSSRLAVIAGTGADMDIPNGVFGNGRTGRAKDLTGTFRMGTDADASVMPSIPSAHTNATVHAIAERAAELLD